MERHKERQHKEHIVVVSNPAVAQKPVLGNPNLFIHCENEPKIETAEDLRNRILAESRRISDVRPPGRPPKVRLPQEQSTPKIKKNFPRPPAIQRRDSSASSIEDGRSPSYRIMDYNPTMVSLNCFIHYNAGQIIFD